MNHRVLTIDQMLDQEDGEQAVLLTSLHGYPVGTPLTRRKSYRDDYASVAYFLEPNHFQFFEEGEVGILEVEAVTNAGACAGRTCVDFSNHLEIKPLAQVIDELAAAMPTQFADLVDKGESVDTSCTDQLGMFRPVLEARKLGKIRVELVDHGFPLALRAVAKVMTWAQDAKGYKDHDWQNLPNAEVALEAAASRHRTDHIMQRHVDGLLIERCVDPESGLLHKAHEAFGVLAQLELALRGDFDLGVDSVH